MEPLIEYRLELAGHRTRALELEGDGPPLLLLHGFADSADTWRRTLDRLARRGRRALALDMPGFGAAGRLGPGPVLPQLDAFAAAAAGRLQEEHGEAPFVVGNSLGGCVALLLGENRDVELAGVVPVAPAGLDHPAWFRVIESAPVVRALLASPLPVPEAVVRGAVGVAYRQLAFARPRAAARDVVSAFTAHHRDRRAVARYLETGGRLLPELRFPFRLDEVRAPVLLVWGENDRMVPSKGSQHIIDAIPETTYELIERCGHCPQIEEPDRFVDVLLEFASASLAAH
ncbi:MAG: alpha/beta fold hydrolase [Solirubrobacteraceae bacterium]